MSHTGRIIEMFEEQEEEVKNMNKRIKKIEESFVEMQMKINLLLQEIKDIDYALRKLKGEFYV